jgi:hypothetical protein
MALGLSAPYLEDIGYSFFRIKVAGESSCLVITCLFQVDLFYAHCKGKLLLNGGVRVDCLAPHLLNLPFKLGTKNWYTP